MQDFSELSKVICVFLEVAREKWGMYIKYLRPQAGFYLCKTGSPLPFLGMAAKEPECFSALVGGKQMHVLEVEHSRFMRC